MSISEQVNVLSTEQESKKNPKVKVLSAEIVVHGTKAKPYYEIKYYDLSDGQYHIGYSSYDLNNVFGWLEECFEIVKENKHDAISEQLKELRDFADKYKVTQDAVFGTIKVLNDAADTIEPLSAKLQATNMERSTAYYNGGWIPCSERLPKVEDWYMTTYTLANSKEFSHEMYFDGENWIDEDIETGIGIEPNVIAWQHRPKPYKP